jgi:hypothetical protein
MALNVNLKENDDDIQTPFDMVMLCDFCPRTLSDIYLLKTAYRMA